MAITLNASTQSGLVVSPDQSGVLQLQTGSSPALTVDGSQNVGIGTASPSYRLDVQGTTANQRISSTTGTNAAYQIFSNTGQNLYVGLDNSAGNQILSASYGATFLGSGAYPMVFGTNNTERLRIDSSGNSMFKTKKIGMGTQSGNSKEVQTISYSGSSGNATIDLLTNTAYGENCYGAVFFLNVPYAGKAVSRMYFLTGRYAASTLTMYQGGTRAAGEDAYLQLTGGSNTIGLQLVLSGWPAAVNYYVTGFIGITTNYYDNWFSN